MLLYDNILAAGFITPAHILCRTEGVPSIIRSNTRPWGKEDHTQILALTNVIMVPILT